MSEFKFPQYKIKDTEWLAERLKEPYDISGTRYCFILGSGASRESGIPTGEELGMRWMDYLMGVKNDYPKKSNGKKTEEATLKLAKALEADGCLQYKFSTIRTEWERARKAGKNKMPGKYYFDIYKLRFVLRKEGYRYLEDAMSGCEPSLGYQALAILLTRNNDNNIVITTNFDSLVEDALFVYTNKRPLVAVHETLADFIDINLQRPMVAKVHNGLLFDPKNDPKSISKLSPKWKEALSAVFSMYTPIVIGYSGGDGSLMNYLKNEAKLGNGIYWCIYKGDMPEPAVQKLIDEHDDGFIIDTAGFDPLMLEIGKAVFPNEIGPENVASLLDKENYERETNYREQWDKFNHEEPEQVKEIEAAQDPAVIAEKDREAEARKLLSEARKARDGGDNGKAIDLLDEAAKIDPNNYLIFANRGYVHSQQGDSAKAIADYSESLRLKPDYVIAFNNRGNIYNDNGEYEEAIADLTEAIRLKPDYATAYINRGNVYYKNGKYEEAMADYNEAIRLKPDSAEAHICRGIIYDDNDKHEEAIAEYNEAIRLKPDYVIAYNNRGNAYYKNGKYKEAIADYNEAIRLKPDYAEAHYNRGIVYYDNGLYEEAIADYNEAIRLKPDYAIAYNNRGNAYSKNGKYKEAIADYTDAIRLKPDYALAYKNRAKAYRALGQNDLAEADERRAEEIEKERKSKSGKKLT